MSREAILKMAQRFGDWNGQTIEMNEVGLEQFAVLIATTELEHCISILERLHERSGGQYNYYLHAAKVLRGEA